MESHNEENNENWRLLVYMLDNTEDLSAMKDESGGTLLHKAATINSSKHFPDLLRKIKQKLSDNFSAFINKKNHDGHTALDLAIKEGILDKIMHLTRNGADSNFTKVDNTNSTVLHHVINIATEEPLYELIEETKATIITNIVHSAREKSSAKKLINIKNSDGFTALDLAIKSGYTHIVHLLLSNGADVRTSVTDDTHSTSLHHAINLSKENDTITKITLLKIIISSLKEKLTPDEFKDLINKEDINGSTVLNYAIELNAKDIVDFLIKNEVNIHTKDSNNLTVLHHAMKTPVTQQQVDKKSVILSNIINLASDRLAPAKFKKFIEAENSRGLTALQLAAKYSFKDITNLLIQHEANLNTRDEKYRTVLHNTIRRCTCEDIDKQSIILTNIINLAHKKLDPTEFTDFIDAKDYQGRTALQLAAKRYFKDTVNLLIKKGADVTIKDGNNRTALHYSIHLHDFKNKDYAKTPISDIDERRFRKDNITIYYNIMEYVRHKILNRVEFLMFINQQENKDKFTPIDFAIKYGQYAIFETLSNIKSPYSRTHDAIHKMVLLRAATYGRLRIIRDLLKIREVQKGINTTDEKGETALHKIIATGKTSIHDTIDLLIKNKIDVNIKNSEGKTALCIAVDKLNELIGSNNYTTLPAELKRSFSSLRMIVITLWVSMLISYAEDIKIKEKFYKIKSKIDTVDNEIASTITEQVRFKILEQNRDIYLIISQPENIQDDRIYHTTLDVTDDSQAEMDIVHYTGSPKRTL